MEHRPVSANLPTKPVGPPEYVRISFSNIKANKYYYLERRDVIRKPDGEIDYIKKNTDLVHTNPEGARLANANSIYCDRYSMREFLKKDPVTNEVIDYANFLANSEFESYSAYCRLPDFRTQAGELVSDVWSKIERTGIGFTCSQDTVDADLDEDGVTAFYTITPAGRRHTRRNRRNSRKRRNTRRNRH